MGSHLAQLVELVLGPITYIVETEEGICWKLHADQLKQWVSLCSDANLKVLQKGSSDVSH